MCQKALVCAALEKFITHLDVGSSRLKITNVESVSKVVSFDQAL